MEEGRDGVLALMMRGEIADLGDVTVKVGGSAELERDGFLSVIVVVVVVVVVSSKETLVDVLSSLFILLASPMTVVVVVVFDSLAEGRGLLVGVKAELDVEVNADAPL